MSYKQIMKVELVTEEDGRITEEVISKDITDANILDMLKFFLSILHYQTFVYIDDLVATSSVYDWSATYGRRDLKTEDSE